ncbi:zf-CCHC domain-containing protein [Tanacetum coccineum]|uniref:Zf-CCHC domain-containing protein n=1 Tax=Tanacetum coccineum TaxID=301880 RepID=A0ABQ5FE07_9ASTR
MSTQQDINAIRAQRLANTYDPLALMAKTQTPFHPNQSSLITYLQHPQPNKNFILQPSFNTNYMQQPIQNPEDILDPTTTIDMTLVLMAKAFTLNDTTPTDNNQRRIQNRYNAMQNVRNQVVLNAVQNPGVQTVGNQNGLSADLGIANQYGIGNVVTARTEGNGNGINGNQMRCYNCRGLDHFARNCTVKPRKRDAAYFQTTTTINASKGRKTRKKQGIPTFNLRILISWVAAASYHEIKDK